MIDTNVDLILMIKRYSVCARFALAEFCVCKVCSCR